MNYHQRVNMYLLDRIALFFTAILIASCATVHPASTETPLKAEAVMSFANWSRQEDSRIIKPGESWQILAQQTQIPISILRKPRLTSVRSMASSSPASSRYRVVN